MRGALAAAGRSVLLKERRARMALRAALASVLLAAYTALGAVAALLALAPAALGGGPAERGIEPIDLARPEPPARPVRREAALPR